MKIKMRIVRSFQEPTRDMVKFFEARTAEHIQRVAQNLLILERHFPFLTENEAIRRGKDHDHTKFDIENYNAYVWLTHWHSHDKNDNIYPDGMKEKTYQATGRHIKSEPHHPEYWDDIRDMTQGAMAEMVSDWMAMSEELNTDIYDWMNKNIRRWDFSENQLELIGKFVYTLLKEKAEENTLERANENMH